MQKHDLQMMLEHYYIDSKVRCTRFHAVYIYESNSQNMTASKVGGRSKSRGWSGVPTAGLPDKQLEHYWKSTQVTICKRKFRWCSNCRSGNTICILYYMNLNHEKITLLSSLVLPLPLNLPQHPLHLRLPSAQGTGRHASYIWAALSDELPPRGHQAHRVFQLQYTATNGGGVFTWEVESAGTVLELGHADRRTNVNMLRLQAKRFAPDPRCNFKHTQHTQSEDGKETTTKTSSKVGQTPTAKQACCNYGYEYMAIVVTT